MVSVLILVAVCLLLAGPAALILVWAQRKQIRRLEQTVVKLANETAGPLQGSREHPEGDTAPRHDSSLAGETTSRPVASTLSHRRDIESIVGSEWLTWIGILAIFFGTAFFLGVGIEPSVFAGLGQILVGVGVSVAFLIVGVLLQRRRVRFLGHGLLGGGIALLYLACYASVEFHHLIDSSTGWVLLSICSIAGAGLALFLNNRTVAGLTVLGAIVTPLLVEVESARVFFFIYVFLVNVAASFVAVRRGWYFVPTISFVGSVLLGIWWMDTAYQPTRDWWLAFLGISSLWGIHFFAPLVGRRAPYPWHLIRTLVIFLNAFAYLGFLSEWLEPDFTNRQGLVASVLALLYVGVGAVLLSTTRTGRDSSADPPSGERTALPLADVTHYVGIVLAAVAIPLQFEAELVGVAWGALGLALVEIGLRRVGSGHRWLGYAVLAMSFLFELFRTMEGLEQASRRLHDGSLLSGMAIAFALAVAAWRTYSRADSLSRTEKRLTNVFVVSAAALTWALITLETGVRIRAQAEEGLDPAKARLIGRLTLSLVWAAYGAALLAFGFLRSFRPVRLVGVVVLVALIGKVFLIDIQDLERGYRIASFLVLGVVLLSVSIAYQRRRED